MNKPISTRYAYGLALSKLGGANKKIVVLDGGTNNSTFASLFKNKYPERYLEMYIAEQNMIGVAVGLSRLEKIPCVSTFAAFLTRAHDQIRMASYSRANLKICGSHAGVSIGEDGVSQMGLEDLALFRSVHNTVVLYPADEVATFKLVSEMLSYQGLVYIRTTRMETPAIYDDKEEFPLGELKVVKRTETDDLSIIGAGITLHEALFAFSSLKEQGINARIIDLYCLKPLDMEILLKAISGTKTVLTVEDHYPEGGLGETVKGLLVNQGLRVESLSVNKLPVSGSPSELLAYEEIDRTAIVKRALTLVGRARP